MSTVLDDLYNAASEAMKPWEGYEVNESFRENAAIDVVDTILEKLNIALAPKVGEAK